MSRAKASVWLRAADHLPVRTGPVWPLGCGLAGATGLLFAIWPLFGAWVLFGAWAFETAPAGRFGSHKVIVLPAIVPIRSSSALMTSSVGRSFGTLDSSSICLRSSLYEKNAGAWVRF